MAKTKITLGERLKDLRVGKDMTLAELAGATGIPLSTLQRMEGKDDYRAGHPDVAALAKFYGVSTDYLFDLTDNKEHENTDLGSLHLSDETIELLKNGKLNNRLLCEMLTHPDFPEWLAALEVYIDQKGLENLEIINASYKVMLDTITIKTVPEEERDEYIATLKEASIDGDDYLRFRLSQRFDKIARSLYDAHKKEAEAETGGGYIKSLMAQVEKFQSVQSETKSTEEAKLALLADQLGVNMKKSTDEEKRSLLSFLGRSKFAQFIKRRK